MIKSVHTICTEIYSAACAARQEGCENIMPEDEMITEEYTDARLVKIFSHSKLFQGMASNDIAELIPKLKGDVVTVKPFTTYHSEGEKITRAGVILSGSLVVSKMLKEGGENLIQKLQAGYMAGVDIACTTTQINPYRIYSVSGADIYEFPVDVIYGRNRLPDNVHIILTENIMTFLANENIRRQYKIDVLTTNSLRDRIMMYLETRSRKLSKDQFRIPYDRQEMANYLCVNRSALSHELSMMRRDGLIDFRKDYFKLL